jgi:hypothetical protein
MTLYRTIAYIETFVVAYTELEETIDCYKYEIML